MTAAVAFPALGFDPAPGEPSAVDALASGCERALRELADAREAVLRTGQEGTGWEGRAAEGFRATAAELPGRIDTIGRSMESAGAALRLWHADLIALQRSAQVLEADAGRARDALAAAVAHPDLALRSQVFTDPTALADAEQRLAAAERAVSQRQAGLDDVRRRAEQLRAEHADLGADLARALARARDLVPPPDAWIGELFVDVAAPVVTGATWVRDHANTIAALSDVTGDLATLTGTIGAGLVLTGPGSPVGLLLGGVSGGLSTLALAGHAAAKAGGADVPWDTIVWDAVGAVTLGFGRASPVVREFVDSITVSTPGIQHRLEEMTDDRAATVLDNLEKYWVPRDPSQWVQYGTGDPLLVPYTNAWRDGRALDEQAAREREGR